MSERAAIWCEQVAYRLLFAILVLGHAALILGALLDLCQWLGVIRCRNP